ncbi:MAG: hypothetical protein LAP40_19790 [Acidobacteriia bacterium]|nr:hypothetical protein [Terriglobia bacterium]
MLPGEFELYGQRFRWMEPDAAGTPLEDNSVALTRIRQPIPSDAVEWLSRGDERIPGFGKFGDCSVYRFEGVADFLFPGDGRFLKMFLHPEADHAALEFALERGVLPRILHLRGTTCLHASAVAVDGGVIAFCGHSGAGKSTLAAALVSRGFPLVSDDVLPLRVSPRGDEVWAGPGLPELRIHPAMANLLGVAAQVAPPLHGQTKVRWQPRRAPSSPLPLRAIYLLDAGLREQSSAPASLWPLPRHAALMDLISHSFWVHPRETTALGKDMLCLGGLLRSVEVSRLAFELTEGGFTAVETLIASTVRAVTQ